SSFRSRWACAAATRRCATRSTPCWSDAAAMSAQRSNASVCRSSSLPPGERVAPHSPKRNRRTTSPGVTDMPKAMQRYRLARRRPPHDDTLRSGRNLQTAVPCVLAAAGLAALAGCDGGSGGTGASGGNGGDEREPFVSIERSGGSRTAQPPAGQTGGEQTSQADGQPVQRQADLALGTFDSNRTAAPEGEQPGGRLPVDGDRSAYIPAV